MAGAVVVACVALCGCLREATNPPVPTPPAAGTRELSGAPRDVFIRALAFYDRGALDEARPLFRALLGSYPALEDYHLAYLAAIEERTAHPREVMDLEQRLLAAHPASVWAPEAAARLARAAFALGDPRAEDLAQRARATAADDADVRGIAMSVLAGLRAPTEPRAAYELYQGVRRGGGSAAAAARDASRALEREHPELLSDPTLLLAEGRLLLAEGSSDLAMQRLDAAAALTSGEERGDALRVLAKAQQQGGRLEDAIATYRLAIAAEAEAGMARFELASLLWNRDRDAEARPLLMEVADERRAHPKRDAARYALGRIAEQEDRATEAIDHYRRLVTSGDDPELIREARWRLAWIPYRRGELATALAAFAAMEASDSASDRAASKYWRGRILTHMRRETEGRSLFAAVLDEMPDGYYADLAEQALSSALPPADAPTPIPPESTAALAAHEYHWSRSRELAALGMNRAAVRELAALADELAAGDNLEPSLLAAYVDVDAYARALRLAQRLGGGALPPSTLAAYLHPRAYWSHVTAAASANRLDPYVVLALMRQESLFDPNAVSPAAAYGLMQLLPSTAARVAGRPIGTAALVDPGTNIEIGTRYLRALLDHFDGDLAKALAAYNGGEEAVAKWERRAPGAATDEFVESISYRETKNYVKQVLANYRRYRRLYGALGERRAVEADVGVYEDVSASAPTSFSASPPNPPFDISTTTSPGAT